MSNGSARASIEDDAGGVEEGRWKGLEAGMGQTRAGVRLRWNADSWNG